MMNTKPIRPVLILIPLLLITFISGLGAQEAEDSLEELKRVRDSLRNDVEQLHQEIQEVKETDSSEPDESNEAFPHEHDHDDNEEYEYEFEYKYESNEEKSKEELEDEIEELKDKLDDVKEELEEELEDFEEKMADAKDQLREELDEMREEEEEERERRKHSIIFCPQLLWLDRGPLEKLVNTDLNLIDKRFRFRDNYSLMLGVLNYHEVENGFRIGSGLSVGYKSYQSRPFSATVIDTIISDTGMVIDTNYNDSLIVLRAIPAHLGFICEKSFHFPNFNIFAGFMVGGGALVVIKNNLLYKVDSIFIGDSEYENNISVAVAPAFMWDIHAGTAIKVAPNFHIGFDWVMLFAYAHDGFGATTDDFVSVNPGIRLRVTFGSAG